MTTTKQLQQALLEVYKEVMRVCNKHKIPCFVLAGTKLGAVRHGGFIPWDDDIDVGIKIEDFERFKRACRKDLKEPYEFKELPWIGGKVHNKNTAFVEAPCAMHRENGYGLFVDIFPLIGIPDDPEERFGFMNNMLLYSFQAMVFDRYPEASKYSKAQIKEWRDSLTSRCKLSEVENYAEFSFGHRYYCKTAGLEKPLEMKFEDTMALVPSTYVEDLTAQYGDYMKLPPKEQRHAHGNLAYVDLKHSYTEYYDKLEKLDPEILALLKQKHKFEGEAFLNSALFMADGNELRHRLEKIQSSKTYKVATKAREIFRK